MSDTPTRGRFYIESGNGRIHYIRTRRRHDWLETEPVNHSLGFGASDEKWREWLADEDAKQVFYDMKPRKYMLPSHYMEDAPRYPKYPYTRTWSNLLTFMS